MPLREIPKLLPLIAAISLMPACASLQKGQQKLPMQDQETQEVFALTDVSDPEDFGSPLNESGLNPDQFSQENLMDLMVAEMAARRQQFDVVLDNYMKVARRTHDEGVVTRAFGIAQYLKNDEALAEMTALWAEIAPENVDVQQQQAFELVKARDFPGALAQMEKILELGGTTSFDRLALQAKSLDPEQQQELLELYRQVLERHPDNDELRYGYAVLQEMTGDPAGARATCQQLLEKSPENGAVITLMATLIKNSEGIEATIDFLNARQELLLKDSQLGNFYARALIEGQRLDEAETVYEELVDAFPKAHHLKLALALVALENQNPEKARGLLEDLVSDQQHKNDAHFYLARIAEAEQDPEKAILHYSQVERGGNFFNALARSAFLLTQLGRPQEADRRFREARQNTPSQAEQIWELEISLYVELDQTGEALSRTDRALGEYPSSNSLRYTRAMLYERVDNLDAMEKDLREILENDPENAVALNALGYTLADRTDRLEEASQLIDKALQLDPDNPAILDSKGWVLFRQGRTEEALGWIRKAYERFPDPEVGAHLGEILWSLGQEEEAMQIFQHHFNEDPDHRILKKTLQHLNIDLTAAP